MNGLYQDNSIDALNLYSQRIEADMSRFTGGATKKKTKKGATKVKLTGAQKDAAFARSKAQAAKDTESASTSFIDSLLASFASPKAAKRVRAAKPPRPRSQKLTAQQKAARARAARENKKLDKLIAIQEAVSMQYPNINDDRFEVEVTHKLNPRSKTTPIGRSYFGKLARQGCLSAIDNDDRYGYLCNRIAPPARPRKRKGAGLSGLGYASGLSGVEFSRASGLSAAGLSGGVSRAKVAQMERWSDYQNEINNLRNMGHSYRQAQQMAKHILRIN